MQAAGCNCIPCRQLCRMQFLYKPRCKSFMQKIMCKRHGCVRRELQGGCNCRYKDSNFGTDANNADKTYDYIAGRTATIFQTIIGGSSYFSNITTTKFVECENDRVTCDGITMTGCTDTDVCP